MYIATFGNRNRSAPVPEGVIVGVTKSGKVVHRVYTAGCKTAADLMGAPSYCGYRPHGINSCGQWRGLYVEDPAVKINCERCLASVNAPGSESIANTRALEDNYRQDNA